MDNDIQINQIYEQNETIIKKINELIISLNKNQQNKSYKTIEEFSLADRLAYTE